MQLRLTLVLLSLLLAACTPVAQSPIITPTSAPAATSVPITVTPKSSPTAIPVILTATQLVPKATKANQQVYLDPNGWFSVNLPAAWEANGANAFSGEDGFFEAGYLPEMMYRRGNNACQWLANVETRSTYYVFYTTAGGCRLFTYPGTTPAIVQAVLENPMVDNEQRLFYIKADAEHFDEIMSTFAWLRPVDQYREPEFHSLPMRAGDAAFWEAIPPVSARFTIEEYALLPESQDTSPLRGELGYFIPDNVQMVDQQEENDANVNRAESVVEQLKALGYELQLDSTGKTTSRVYKDGKLLLEVDGVGIGVRRFYTFSTPSKAGVVFVISSQACDKSYLIQNDSVVEWGKCFNDPDFTPILYKGDLLWLRAPGNGQIQVLTSQRDILLSFATYHSGSWTISRFRSWRGHWILEIDEFADGFLVEDGEIVNEKYGFEEAYGWQLVNDRPFYFFRKGPRVGVSYGGEFMALGYDEIAHGRFNDPIGDGQKVAFFGRRDGTWYYVILEAK